jgi:hypothetical protein
MGWISYSDPSNRVAGSIRGISRESRKDQFERFLSDILKVFGGEFLDEKITDFLLKAYDLRGRVAHGHYQPADDKDFSESSKSICALESVCYLLTIKDLPIANEGKKRVRGLPLVHDYLASYVVNG